MELFLCCCKNNTRRDDYFQYHLANELQETNLGVYHMASADSDNVVRHIMSTATAGNGLISQILPLPLISLIFSYLAPQDLVAVSRVCRYFFAAAMEDRLWEGLFVATYGTGWYKETMATKKTLSWRDAFRLRWELYHSAPSHKLNIALLGLKGSGCTSLKYRWILMKFKTGDMYLDRDRSYRCIKHAGRTIKVEIAEEEDYAPQNLNHSNATEALLSQADGVMIVIDATDSNMLSNLILLEQHCQSYLKAGIPVLVAANKIDLLSDGMISKTEGIESAAFKLRMTFKPLSAKTGHGVEDAFNSLVSDSLAVLLQNQFSKS